MTFRFLLSLLVLLAVVLVVIFVVQRVSGRRQAQPGSGEIVAYLLAALAVGVVGFALAELLATAFPGERFVFDPAEELANSLSALVVAAPLAFYLWRRQADRRRQRPDAVGWVIYLTLMELVFLTAFIVAAVTFLDGLFNRGSLSSWPQMVVFGSVVVFHELAQTRTPPTSDGAELSRVVGSAITWITAAVGLAGVIGAGVLTYLYETVVDNADSPIWHPFVSMAIVGLPLWAYRWLRPWLQPRGVLRTIWATVVAVGSLSSAIGWATVVGAMVIEYLFSLDRPAGAQLDMAPLFLGIALVGAVSWVEHRRRLGDRSGLVPWYEYAMAGIGLASSVGLALALTILVFDRPEIVGGGMGDILAVAFSLAVALVVWRYFDHRWLAGETEDETTSWARRLYTLGLGIVLGLTAAGGLISTLFNLLRRFLDGGGEPLLTPFSTFLYSGLAAWYLITAYRRDRDRVESEEVTGPFDVTLITSHPGMIATKFPRQARLTVLHRGDGVGPIDDEMGDAIVAEVGNTSSIVWVDQDGFRVAPKRTS